MKRARLPRGTPAARRARAALGGHAAAVDVASFAEALPRCPEAARFWSERAWSELAAVPAMAQIQLALLRAPADDGAADAFDTDVLGAFAQIGADEVRHAELARDLAERLGGYVEEIPAEAPWDPARFADPTSTPLAFWIVSSGCISETISLALMEARLAHTTHPAVRAVLSAVIKDEAAHQRIAWELAERSLPALSEETKRALAANARAMFDVIGVSFATAGLTGDARDEARRLRAVTAARGLGAAPPDEEDAVCRAAIEARIAPRLAALGLPLG